MSDLIPRITEPTTAYDLLTKVCEVITEEPKRYNQGRWLRRERGRSAPACGTVGCVAGWCVALVDSTVIDDRRAPIGDRAMNILGIDEDQRMELFAGDAVADFPLIQGQGGHLYARAGVRHIRRFQEKYAEQLKAKVVTPVEAK